MDTILGEGTVIFVFAFFSVRVDSSTKEFAPLGLSKFFLVGIFLLSSIFYLEIKLSLFETFWRKNLGCVAIHRTAN